MAIDGLVSLHKAAFICMISLRDDHCGDAQDLAYNLGAWELVAIHLNRASLIEIELKCVVDETVRFGTVAGLSAFADMMPA